MIVEYICVKCKTSYKIINLFAFHYLANIVVFWIESVLSWVVYKLYRLMKRVWTGQIWRCRDYTSNRIFFVIQNSLSAKRRGTIYIYIGFEENEEEKKQTNENV